MAEHNTAPPHDETAADTAATLGAGNGIPNSQSGGPTSAGADGSRKRMRQTADEDDDDEDSKPGRERRKIEIKFIQDKSRRHITFSKRKAGIMKKAYELSVLTGTQVLLLVVSETGLVYTFTTPKLQPLVTKSEGKNLIQACLNAPEPHNTENGVQDPDPSVDSPEEPPHAQLPQQPTNPRAVGMPVPVNSGPYMQLPPDAQVQAQAQAQAHQAAAAQQAQAQQQAQQQAYQQYMQQQAHARVQTGYMPQHPGHPAQNA